MAWDTAVFLLETRFCVKPSKIAYGKEGGYRTIDHPVPGGVMTTKAAGNVESIGLNTTSPRPYVRFSHTFSHIVKFGIFLCSVRNDPNDVSCVGSHALAPLESVVESARNKVGEILSKRVSNKQPDRRARLDPCRAPLPIVCHSPPWILSTRTQVYVKSTDIAESENRNPLVPPPQLLEIASIGGEGRGSCADCCGSQARVSCEVRSVDYL
ncbi:hypothetical protein J6590_090712 [Homalodisca vitripennis]|nr:hypothetical protein J6590_090712 [Homalodisca vitripennis]